MTELNPDVTKFLDELNHPLRVEIDQLRVILLESVTGLSENIKWNGPNYSFAGNDRVTMRIHPPKLVQLIFHRGSKKTEQPEHRIIDTDSRLLIWKENDRAFITFKNLTEIEANKTVLAEITKKWIEATR